MRCGGAGLNVRGAAQIAGSERVVARSSAVVMCAEITREPTPDPSIWQVSEIALGPRLRFERRCVLRRSGPEAASAGKDEWPAPKPRGRFFEMTQLSALGQSESQ